jgi:hypothetical protein
MAGEEGFEPSNAGIKIRCLDQLGDSPAVARIAWLASEARIIPGISQEKKCKSAIILVSLARLIRVSPVRATGALRGPQRPRRASFAGAAGPPAACFAAGELGENTGAGAAHAGRRAAADRQARCSAITGSGPQATVSRSLPPNPGCHCSARSAANRASAPGPRKMAAVGTCHRRFETTRYQRAGSSTACSVSPTPFGKSVAPENEDRYVGAELQADFLQALARQAELPEMVERQQDGRGIRAAAAQAAAEGSCFSMLMSTPGGKRSAACSRRAARTVRSLSGGTPGKRCCQTDGAVGRAGRNAGGRRARENETRLQQVVAIGCAGRRRAGRGSAWPAPDRRCANPRSGRRMAKSARLVKAGGASERGGLVGSGHSSMRRRSTKPPRVRRRAGQAAPAARRCRTRRRFASLRAAGATDGPASSGRCPALHRGHAASRQFARGRSGSRGRPAAARRRWLPPASLPSLRRQAGAIGVADDLGHALSERR